MLLRSHLGTLRKIRSYFINEERGGWSYGVFTPISSLVGVLVTDGGSVFKPWVLRIHGLQGVGECVSVTVDVRYPMTRKTKSVVTRG